MKKSEALKEIIFWLEHTEHIDLPTSISSDFNKAAEELLARLEELGMLPPKTKLNALNIEDNAWEPEDEKK
jgi:hypothetical protein